MSILISSEISEQRVNVLDSTLLARSEVSTKQGRAWALYIPSVLL